MNRVRYLKTTSRSTFNVLMAAADKKTAPVVFSSSAFGMGWAHDPRAFMPLYLPLDEEHR